MALPPTLKRSMQAQAQRVLATGQRYTSFNQIRQRHFWSEYLFSPDANGYINQGEFDLFTTPPGQTGQGWPVPLTDLETNWKSANRVPDNQNFEITEIGVTASPLSSKVDAEAAGADEVIIPQVQNSFLAGSLVAITYLTNAVELGYSQDFAQASGPVGGTYTPFSDITQGETKTGTRYATNGFCAPGLRRRFKIPILLQHGESFAFRFIVPRSFWSFGKSIAARIDFWATESFVEKS